MKISISFIVLSLTLIICGCSKDDVDPGEIDPGKLIATINGSKWAPPKHKAIYYPKWRQILIIASDANHTLIAGIHIDSVNVFKNYTLEPNGDNGASIRIGQTRYSSDQNVIDAGGNFVLTKLDTAKKQLSGSLQFIAYPPSRADKIVFASSEITDIPIEIDTVDYDGSYVTCTVNGVKTTNWRSIDLWGKITCIAGASNKRLELHISSLIGGYPDGRYIVIRIPLHNGVGTHVVYPDSPPDFYCGTPKITSRYNLGHYDNSYYAISGTFNISKIDTALRKINASFSINFKDTSSRQETIQITNGILNLNYWSEY
jgi:hypothetical protein